MFHRELFLKQDKCLLKSTIILLFLGDKVIVVSAGWILSFENFFATSRVLQKRTMITIKNDIVAGDVLLWIRGNFYDSFRSIGNDRSRHLFCELVAIRAGSKMGCVELYNFISAAHPFFVRQWKNSIFLVRPGLLVNDILRRDSKTGDKYGLLLAIIKNRQLLASNYYYA